VSSPPGIPSDRSDVRVRALDGLRGFAATVIVACHLFEYTARSEGASALLLVSPLGVLVNGPAAVHLFYVLSGWVLALSMDRDPPRGRLPRFYVRRIFRIHPPYMAGLLFAWAASFGFPLYGSARHAAAGGDWTCMQLPMPRLVESLWFPGFAFGQLPVGWSLQVELMMSAVFPLLFWVGRRLHPLAPLALGVPLLWPLEGWLYFLNFTLDFALGLVLYLERDRLAALAARIGWRGAVAAGLGAWFLLAAPYPLAWQLHRRAILPGGGHTPYVVLVLSLGSALLLAISLYVPAVRRALEGPAATLLGRLSYGVYLVHFTVLMGIVCRWTGPRIPPLLALALFPVLLGFSLMVAELIHRYVELPSIRAGKALGAGLARGLGRGAAPPA
jgi:peptidoglycan/LPS O-acetylase OafA/YrhL